MARINGIRRYLRVGREAESVRREIDDELAFHFRMAIDELVARGYTRDQAEREAERRFGNVAIVRERLTRLDEQRLGEERRADWWSALAQDSRYAARGLGRSLGFTLGVVLTLALGIGANAAVFALIDRLLLRPAPHLADAKMLRRVHVEMVFENGRRDTRGPMSYAEFAALRPLEAFSGVGAFNYPVSVAMGRGVDAPRIERSGASAEFFRVLGVQPDVGRFFAGEDDDDAVARPAAVLSYAFWQRQFAGQRSVIGETLVLDGKAYVIVGVAPKGFSGADVDAPDVWIPLASALAADDGPRWRDNKQGFGLHLVARLRPDVSAERAAAQAAVALRPAHQATFLSDLPASVQLGSVIPGRRLDRTDQGLTVATRLLGAAAMVLLIACANVANLLLARALSRRRELAVRLALGVGRARLAAQVITESVLLALLAGSAALTVAVWGGSVLRALLMPNVTWSTPPVDARVLAFTFAIACTVGLLAGLVPALQMTREDLIGSLKAGWRDVAGGRSLIRGGLIVVQAAFTVLLLVGAGLFVRSLDNARTRDLGFSLDRTILAEVGFPRGAIPLDEADAVYGALADRVRPVAGVSGVSVTGTAPFWTFSFESIFVPGRDSLPSDVRAPMFNPADPSFLSTMGIRLTAGRAFTSSDRAGAPGVVIVNETLGGRLWPNESPLGRCFRVGADTAPCRTIVGVVRDIGSMNLRDRPLPQFYVPMAQIPASRRLWYIVVRATGESPDLRVVSAAIRNALRGARPDIEAINVRPFADLLEPEIRPFRLGAMMFGVFGVIALLLAGVGLYAVIAFDVARRTRELGIRTALGARAWDVVRLVLGQGLRVTALGVAVGVALALALGRIVETLLFGVTARDPGVLVSVAVTLIVVASAASVIPAWRAARVDPLAALRED